MDASCEYVAGSSRVFPIVRKNKLNKLNTSASVVSRRLSYVVSSLRTSFNFVTARIIADRSEGWNGPPTLLYDRLVQGIDI